VSTLETWIDPAIGDAREALVKDGAPIAFRILRWSDEGRRARWGEVYAARVLKTDPQRRGAFLDLGLSEEQGFLPFSGAPNLAVREGGLIEAEIVREAARGKSPVVRLRKDQADSPPRRLSQPEVDLDLLSAPRADRLTRERLDSLAARLQSQAVGLAGGGALQIEPTAALVAIDVDAQGRQGSRDGERFALDLNMEAGRTALRELRLRSLGGLAAIDFVNLRREESRNALQAAMKAAAADDPWGVQLARLSRFGVMELSRGQLRRPLHEVLGSGAGSPETIALMALRRIEAEAAHAHGRKIEARVAPAVEAWLQADVIGWRAALQGRIGLRWTIIGDPRLKDDQVEAVAQ
jgi:Ribonuclease G/E